MSEHAHSQRPVKQAEASLPARPMVSEMEAPGLTDPYSLTPAKIMQLQKTHGNRAVQAMFKSMQTTSPVVQRDDTAVAPPLAPPSPASITAPPQAPSTSAPAAPAAAAPVPAAPTATPMEQRKAALEQERDSRSELLASDGFASIQTKVMESILAYLLTDKKTAGLRQSITETATAKIKADIDADPRATDQEKADAKKATDQNAGASTAMRSKASSIEPPDKVRRSGVVDSQALNHPMISLI